MKKKIILAIAALLVIAVIVVYPKVIKPMPPDNAKLTEMNFDGLMGTRYTEILLIFGNGLTKDVTAGVYNSVGLNGANYSSRNTDSSPAAILDKIDMDKVKTDNNALSAIKNGPRRWTVDNIGVKAGKQRDFQGLKAHWVMWFPLPPELLKSSDNPYQPMTAKRDTSMRISKGSRAYMLKSPDGKMWCIKSMGMIVDPNQQFEELKNLGSRLKLPEGWTFTSPVLENELVFKTVDGETQITQDDLGNTYDRVDGDYSNFNP